MMTRRTVLTRAACVGLALLAGTLMVQGASRPLIQAHRGSRGEYDDNAAGGFAWCLTKGIRGFETDIRFSKDKKLVIMHDSRLDRTTDGTGIVEETDLADIRKCRLQACSESVPTAEEVMEKLRGRTDTFIELEMKAYPSAFYTPEVLDEYCRKLNAAAKAILEPGTYAFTCFNTNTLIAMRKVDPKATCHGSVSKTFAASSFSLGSSMEK